MNNTEVDYKIVGIGGLPRSGKDTAAELLMDAGWMGVSFGDLTREYSFERHKDKPDPISRANTTETSNWLRQQYGADVLLQEALRRFEAARAEGRQYKGLVLFSVRAPIEVDFILAHGGELVWIDADDEVRHQRSLKHMREGELPTTLEQFKAEEDEQWKPQPGISEEVQMNVSYVKEHATIVITNNGDDRDAFLADTKRALHLQ
jgi:dephospho-CoA kinase